MFLVLCHAACAVIRRPLDQRGVRVEAAEDSVSFPINPLYCREATFFVAVNGAAAAALYCYARLLPATSISVALTWDQTNPWVQAAAVGISAILVLRSRIFPLKENKSLGLDIVYTRWRDHAMRVLCADTIVARKQIVRRFAKRFVDDACFTDDFADFVLAILSHARQTDGVRAERREVEVLKAKGG